MKVLENRLKELKKSTKVLSKRPNKRFSIDPELVYELLEGGIGLKGVAEIYGCTTQTAGNYMRDHDPTFDSRKIPRLIRQDIEIGRVLELYEQHKSVSAVAKVLGTSWRPIYRRLNSAGVKFNFTPRTKYNNKIKIEEVVSLYQEHGSVTVVADILETNWMMVKRRLSSAGVGTKPKYKGDIKVNEVAKLYQKHKNMVTVAEIIGTSSSIVRRRLYSAGIEVRHGNNDKFKANEVADLYQEHGNVSAVAKHLGTSRALVLHRLNSAGIKLKSGGYTGKILEEILKGHKISDFSRNYIVNSWSDDDTIRATYNVLKKIGLSDHKIASQAHLLGRNPDTIEKNYQKLSSLGIKDHKIASRANLLSMNPDTIEKNHQRLSDLGLSNNKIATLAYLLGMNPDTIEKNHQKLSDLGLSNNKIASQAHLLSRNPDIIKKNYQNHVGLLRKNYQNHNSGREVLFQQASLLGTSKNTLDANVQWFKERNLDYGNGMALGTKPQTKRKKLAWMLRELFDYRKVPENQRNKTIEKMYNMVRDNSGLLIKSITTLEKTRDKLREKAELYK